MLAQSQRKGLILAGGSGRRLFPSTLSTNKHLFIVCDKPMIYYPLTTLMLCGIRDILIITTPHSIDSFRLLLNDGSQWGINLKYKIQSQPDGITKGILLSEEHVGNDNLVVALGDNIFHGNELFTLFNSVDLRVRGATVFSYPVSDPERYGVVEFDDNGLAINIYEKPEKPKSNFAITGLYFYDNTVFDRARSIDFSSRNELEVTSLNNSYIRDGLLRVESIGRGMAWFDVGTFDSLHNGSVYIRTIQLRQGFKVGCPEEVAWRQGWINDYQFEKLAEQLKNSQYGEYLLELLKKKKSN